MEGLQQKGLFLSFLVIAATELKKRFLACLPAAFLYYSNSRKKLDAKLENVEMAKAFEKKFNISASLGTLASRRRWFLRAEMKPFF